MPFSYKSVASIGSAWHYCRRYKGDSGQPESARDRFEGRLPGTLVDLLNHLYMFSGKFWTFFTRFVLERDAVLRTLETNQTLMRHVYGHDVASETRRSAWRTSCQRAINAAQVLQLAVRSSTERLVNQVIKSAVQRGKYAGNSKTHNDTEPFSECCRELSGEPKKLTGHHRKAVSEFESSVQAAYSIYERDLRAIEVNQLSRVADQELDQIQRSVFRVAASYLRVVPNTDASCYLPGILELALPSATQLSDKAGVVVQSRVLNLVPLGID